MHTGSFFLNYLYKIRMLTAISTHLKFDKRSFYVYNKIVCPQETNRTKFLENQQSRKKEQI